MSWFRYGFLLITLFGVLQHTNCQTTCHDCLNGNCQHCPLPNCQPCPVDPTQVTQQPNCDNCHVFPTTAFQQPLICHNCYPQVQPPPPPPPPQPQPQPPQPQQPPPPPPQPPPQQNCQTCYIPNCANCAAPQICQNCALDCQKCGDVNGCPGDCHVTTCQNCQPHTCPPPNTITCPPTCITCPPTCGNCTNGNTYYWTENVGDVNKCQPCSTTGGQTHAPWMVDRDDRVFFDYDHGEVAVSSSSSAAVKYPKTGAEGKPQAFISSVSNAKADPDATVTVVDGGADGQPKHTWGYRETADAYGPDNWAKIAPKCAGTNQSPINIVTANALERDIENPIAISMDDPSGAAIIKGRLVNNGKTIGFEVGPNSPPVKVTADIFEGKTFVLKQFHLHFGCEGQKGSEHSIDGEKFSGEMHLVFKNEKYANPKVAMQQKDGLAILAFFLQVRPDAEANPAFDKIASNIKNIQFAKQQLVIPGGLSIVNLIPPLQDGLVNLKRYVYKGSLPTPPCYESVTWVVFKRAISIQPERVEDIRGELADGNRLCGNVRDIQPLNARDMFRYENKLNRLPTTKWFSSRPPLTTSWRLHGEVDGPLGKQLTTLGEQLTTRKPSMTESSSMGQNNGQSELLGPSGSPTVKLSSASGNLISSHRPTNTFIITPGPLPSTLMSTTSKVVTTQKPPPTEKLIIVSSGAPTGRSSTMSVTHHTSSSMSTNSNGISNNNAGSNVSPTVMSPTIAATHKLTTLRKTIARTSFRPSTTFWGPTWEAGWQEKIKYRTTPRRGKIHFLGGRSYIERTL